MFIPSINRRLRLFLFWEMKEKDAAVLLSTETSREMTCNGNSLAEEEVVVAFRALTLRVA